MSLIRESNKSYPRYQEEKESLEHRLYLELRKDYFLKDLQCYFAVLEQTPNFIVLGGFQEVVGKIQYDYSKKSALESLTRKLLGREHIEVETKTARDEALATKKRIEAKIAKDKKDAAIKEEVDKQIQEGKCDLIPFPLKENKVRSDLTIERHALFAANTFKGDFRAFEREFTDPESGRLIILRIEIGSKSGATRGVLKQKHQEAFYILAQTWEEQSYKLEKQECTPFGYLDLTIYNLVQKIRGNDAGQNYKKTFDLLSEMAAIRVNIKKIDSENGVFDCQDFSLISFDWRAKNFNEKTLRPKSGGESRVRIKFSEFITDNFLKKNIKSLSLDPYFSLKDKGGKGVSQIIYTMLDYELSSKSSFHITLRNLAKKLGTTIYKFKSKRKEKLKSSIEMVNGSLIGDGKYRLNCYLVESQNKKDWVLEARKIPID